MIDEQSECHPLLPQHEVRAYCQKHGIFFQAYSSLGCGEVSGAYHTLTHTHKLSHTNTRQYTLIHTPTYIHPLTHLKSKKPYYPISLSLLLNSRYYLFSLVHAIHSYLRLRTLPIHSLCYC